MPKSNLHVLERTPALIGAPADVLEELSRNSHRRNLSRREALWKQGDPAERFSVLCHGIVKLVRHTPSGRRVICNLVGAPESVGDLVVIRGGCYPASAIAATSVEVVSFPRSLLTQAFVRHPELATSLWQYAQQRMQQLLNTIGVLSAGSVEARLAMALANLWERFGDDFDDGSAVLPLPLTRQELAELVSTSHETAIRVLSAWERRGLVRSSDNGFIIERVKELRAVAGCLEPCDSVPVTAQ